MAEVKQEVKQENLKEVKSPPVEDNQKSGSPKQPEPPKAEPQKEEQQRKAEPEKPKQDSSQKAENPQKQEPDLTQAQAPRDFYKTSDNNRTEATYVPGEAPKERAEKAEDPSKAKGSREADKTEKISDRREPPKDDSQKSDKKVEEGRTDKREEDRNKNNYTQEVKSKHGKVEADPKISSDEGVRARSSESPGSKEKSAPGDSDRSDVQQFRKGAEAVADRKTELRTETQQPRTSTESIFDRTAHTRPETQPQQKGSQPVVDNTLQTQKVAEVTLDKAAPQLQKSPETLGVKTETPQAQNRSEVGTPKPSSIEKQPEQKTIVTEQISTPRPTTARDLVVQNEPVRIIEAVRQVPPEIAVRLTAQIVERFPMKAEAPRIEKRPTASHARQELFKSKVVEPRRIAAPALNTRIRELVAATREVSLQRNVVRTKYGVDAKKELLKDNTSLLKRLRGADRRESIVSKPLQELDRLVIKYSPPLAVKTAAEKTTDKTINKILEKIAEVRKAPEIIIKVFETVTAISTSAERLLSKLKDPSLEKLLPPETLSKLQGLIQELIRSSLPLGTDPEGLTPERLQSLKSKIEELIAKMREELLHLDISEDDISDLIDVLESLNELEALEELLLEELILLEEPSTFEEVLAEENVIIMPKEEEEEVEEVFILEGYVIDSETELGLPHVEVYGGLLGREITDSDGYFSFINIPKSTYITIGLDPELGRCEPEIFSITISNNEMVRFFLTR